MHKRVREHNIYFGAHPKPFISTIEGVPMVSDKDPASLKPAEAMEVKTMVLDLSKPEEEEIHRLIWRAVGLKCAKVFNMDKHWCDSTENWKVHIYWYIDALTYAHEKNGNKLEVVAQLMELT